MPRIISHHDISEPRRTLARKIAANYVTKSIEYPQAYREMEAAIGRVRGLAEGMDACLLSLHVQLDAEGLDKDLKVDFRGEMFGVGEDKAIYLGNTPEADEEPHDERAEWARDHADSVHAG